MRSIGRGFDKRANAFFKIFDSLEKTAFVKKTVVNSDIEAAIRLGVEEAIEAILFHGGRAIWQQLGLLSPCSTSLNSAFLALKKELSGMQRI